jgi:hypothetical protein
MRARAGTRNTSRVRRRSSTPSSTPLLPLFAQPPEIATALRDDAMALVKDHAEDHRPGFHVLALDFVVAFLARFGPTPAEQLTAACKNAGIRPHDDRAFGPVYMVLARHKRIVKVGSVRRERGHGTAGGNVWMLQA